MRLLFAVIAALLCACADEQLPSIDDADYEAKIVARSHLNDPAPDHPKFGCIYPTANQNARADGKLLPEIVRVIGVTSPEDGERWKVLRAGEYDPKKWQPWPKNAIRFTGCGVQMEAFREAAQH